MNKKTHEKHVKTHFPHPSLYSVCTVHDPNLHLQIQLYHVVWFMCSKMERSHTMLHTYMQGEKRIRKERQTERDFFFSLFPSQWRRNLGEKAAAQMVIESWAVLKNGEILLYKHIDKHVLLLLLMLPFWIYYTVFGIIYSLCTASKNSVKLWFDVIIIGNTRTFFKIETTK